MKVPPRLACSLVCGMAWCSLAALAVLLAVLIGRLRVEAEMAGHDPYCYWDAGFPSRSFDVYGQYNYLRALRFSRTRPSLISFLLGWSCGLTSPLCSKSSNVVWAVLHEILRFTPIFLNGSSIAIRCRRLSYEGQPNTLTCVLVQPTS